MLFNFFSNTLFIIKRSSHLKKKIASLFVYAEYMNISPKKKM